MVASRGMVVGEKNSSARERAPADGEAAVACLLVVRLLCDAPLSRARLCKAGTMGRTVCVTVFL